jgi:hypothetical protein
VLTVTNLDANSNAGASIGGFVTDSISPAPDSLLILSIGGFDGAGTQDFTVQSVSGLGLTWTLAKLSEAGSTPKGDVEVWTAVTGASPGSGAITVVMTKNNIDGGIAFCVDQATGENASAPVVPGSVVSSMNSSAVSSLTYDTPAGSSNLFWNMSVVLIGTGGTVTQTPNEAPPWTVLGQTESNTTAVNGAAIMTSVSPDVTNENASATLTASHSWGSVGFEIAVSVTPPVTPSGDNTFYSGGARARRRRRGTHVAA